MNEKVSDVVTGAFVLVNLYVYWMVFKSTNVYWLFGIIVATILLRIIVQYILHKKKKRTKKESSRNKKYGKGSTFNRLREDGIIMKAPLEELSWREFERLCFLYFKAKGFRPKETSKGADGGVDLIIYNKKDGGHEAVQIKHYIASNNQITVKEIREINSAKRNHKCIFAKFITTSHFTNDALREADNYKVNCHSIEWVRKNIDKWRKMQAEKISV
ncbi:restriction endonuclease [Halobacillus sp. Marseille-P3879]|uniref:restriction endonuclease n=1 Tax=Halobacillus sp. Marseille-P3879 TaxID=2045014 RepID=UPI000C7CEF74|nr:restriction endonuclease [Halobacillus sp. Marseille-P3879]